MKQKASNDQRGIARLPLLLVIIALLLLGLIIWFAVRDSKKKAEPGNDIIKNAKCSYSDKDLCKFFAVKKAQTEDYAFTATEQKDTAKTTHIVKVENQSKYYIKTTDGGSSEIIVIGNDLYKRSGEGWTKQTLSDSDKQAYKNQITTTLPEPSDKVSYKKLNTEKCGELTCFKYQKTDKDNAKETTYLWFDTKTYKLRRIQTTQDDVKREAAFSYGNVSITAPEQAETQTTAPTPPTTPTTGDDSRTDLPHTGDDPVSEEENRRLMQQYRP